MADVADMMSDIIARKDARIAELKEENDILRDRLAEVERYYVAGAKDAREWRARAEGQTPSD